VDSLKPWSGLAGEYAVRRISCSGAGYASGRRIACLRIEKIAVLAPIPKARVSSATAVNAGLRRSLRMA
jgi:hypothetical protein